MSCLIPQSILEGGPRSHTAGEKRSLPASTLTEHHSGNFLPASASVNCIRMLKNFTIPLSQKQTEPIREQAVKALNNPIFKDYSYSGRKEPSDNGEIPRHRKKPVLLPNQRTLEELFHGPAFSVSR